MKKVITGLELRDRLLARMQEIRVAEPESWIQAISAPGNRELLRLIVEHSPQSISELSELAGRRQPNVSRALSALISAGLVAIRQEGRRSIPGLTDFGREKSAQMRITADAVAEGSDQTVAVAQASEQEPTLFALEFASESGSVDSDSDAELGGKLSAWLRLQGRSERAIATYTGNLVTLGMHLADNWWTILYRRDAPFKLCDLSFDGEASAFSLSVASSGRRVMLTTRAHDAMAILLDSGFRRMATEAFETSLLEEVLRPIVYAQRKAGYLDAPLQDRLSRIDDSRAYPREVSYCRTAGALGLSPYDIAEDRYQLICKLIGMISDEESRLDFASAVPFEELADGETWAVSEVDAKGATNVLPGLGELRLKCLPFSDRANSKALRPWQWATGLARVARAELNLAADKPVEGTDGLAALFGASKGLTPSCEAPGALRAFQTYYREEPTVVVEDEGPTRTAFVLARAIGDYLAYGSPASCVADLYTDRQAVGRAFAAEFMAPAEAVVAMIEEEDQSPARVARHFGVAPEVVHNQYSNNWR